VSEEPTRFAVFFSRFFNVYRFDVRIVSESEVEKLSDSKKFSSSGVEFELIGLKKIHDRFLQDLREYAESVKNFRKPYVDVLPGLRVGYVVYNVDEQPGEKTALSILYFPKPEKLEQSLPGFGYYIEAICLNHLKKLGVTHVSTTSSPSFSRVAQVSKAKLPVGERVEISDWLKKIGSLGLQQKLGKTKQKQK